MALTSVNLDMIMSNYIILSNEAIGPGGAILISAVKTLSIADSRFDGNHAAFDAGGAIYARPQLSSTIHLTIRGTEFHHNTADKNGGAINTLDATILDISSSNFTGNAAGEGGGAICATSTAKGVIMVASTLFERNLAKTDGGAIRCYRSDIVMKAGTFIGNRAGSLGGGLMVNGAWNGLKGGCSFINGVAGVAGGGLFWKTYFPPVLDPSKTDFNRLIPSWLRNTTWTNNKATYAADVGTTPLWVDATWHGIQLSTNTSVYVDSAQMSPPNSAIVIQARDLLGQFVQLDDVRTAELMLWPIMSDVLMSGTLVSCNRGSANFSGLIVYGQPSSGPFSLNISLIVVDNDEGAERSEHEVLTYYDQVLSIRGCAATTYISGQGAAAMCQSCPEGKFSSLPNQHECVPCMPSNPDISVIDCHNGNWFVTLLL
jgi:predicted outer membrane repeat protein